tara:strand:+ start:13200 stop:14615 length:1416 start_codon:yes stop_codon:yes gene_type:complete
MANASVYSSSFGNTVNGSVSINDARRKFNFGERVAELAPQQSPFFVYLNKVAKKATDDPVFKFLEQRHQWQRRNFEVDLAWDTGAETAGTAIGASAGHDLQITCKYDKYGNISTSDNPCYFILPGQIIGVANDAGTVRRFRINPDAAVTTITTDYSTDDLNAIGIQHCEHTNDGFTVVTAETLTPVGADVGAGESWAVGNKGQVLGSAFGEGTGAPTGWEDSLFDREGYCQIFKTGMNIFSGTAMATSYRGIANEWQRVWTEKLMEHKMDIEHAMLFGIGGSSQEIDPASSPVRYTHGILPYTETNGKVYSMSYASSGYDAFLDAMEDFFAPESGNSGNKLVLASRKVITYLNKLGAGSFLNNSVGSSQYRLDVQSVPGAFGHQVTQVNTIFGNLHFVADPLLRGPWEDYCVGVDMKNVAYRPLSGNGISRDTFIETNVQSPDVDGRQDQIITEAGLEISLPETHAILKWS